jgi:signal transduction histidine kinase
MESKRDHYICQIAEQAEHMDKLVRDMLDLSNIENPSYSLKPEAFDICVLLKGITEQYAVPAAGNNINIHYSSGFESFLIYADRLKIGQVILNFMDNALRHTPESGEITIALTAISDKQAKISVINKGSSISEEDMDKVWERFYRGDKDRNIKAKGTGLGLAISAKILQLHDMAYGINNVPNGVEFYFIISFTSS